MQLLLYRATRKTIAQQAELNKANAESLKSFKTSFPYRKVMKMHIVQVPQESNEIAFKSDLSLITENI